MSSDTLAWQRLGWVEWAGGLRGKELSSSQALVWEHHGFL